MSGFFLTYMLIAEKWTHFSMEASQTVVFFIFSLFYVVDSTKTSTKMTVVMVLILVKSQQQGLWYKINLE